MPQRSDGGGKGVDTKKVYDIVELMPALPNGNGGQAISTAIQQALVLPNGEKAEGRAQVEFVVDRKGRVRDVKVLQAPSPGVGKALLAAVAKLPHFTPGMQNGETTNVRIRPFVLLAPPR
ncbi:TonB family C-terminal domain-containing protein [Hymenobacter arizonensis]|uniref:TonB family C-terminal domain-containing protein n=2 Tax=Hymenobacter arizonensis TaxID=1227077 RepID=A0A1I6BNR5_HYMAR|nr:TonB family C-terminal domain-containing protein [Hymenobacter arizonensis]